MARITNQMTSQSLLHQINYSLDRLTTTQNELSSGKKINQPSDDPYGASLAVRLQGEIAGLDSYSRNVTDGTAWAQASDSALMSISQMAQRVRELAVQGGTGTLSQSDRNDIAAQVDQMIEAVKNEGNTKYNGQYVFSGTATQTTPYPTSTDAYQGDSGTVQRQIGAGTTIAINADLSGVLGSGSAAGDGKLLDTLRTISQDLKSGNAGAVSGADLKNLDANLDSLSELQANVGAVEDRLQLAASRITDLQTSDSAALSSDVDADEAKLMINFSSQQSAYTAALKAGASIMQTSLLDFLR